MSDLGEFNENKLQTPWLETESPDKVLAQGPAASPVTEALAPTLREPAIAIHAPARS